MPQTSKALFRGAATTTTTTLLYTVPASTTTVVTDIVVTNTTGTAGTFTIALNDVSIATTVTISGFDSTVIPLKQVLATTQTIKGGASATTINLHISGVEIS
jgi:ABC-type xylose transport system substrate-binding protein